MVPSSLRVAASFTFPFEADTARLLLEAEGIPACLADTATAGWFWHYSNAVGGVKVLVKTDDVPQATAILAGQEKLGERPGTWTCPQCREQVPGGWEVCWACGTSAAGEADPAFGSLVERLREPVPQRATFAPVDPRLIRACLLACFAVGWFSPFSLVSLWMLPLA